MFSTLLHISVLAFTSTAVLAFVLRRRLQRLHDPVRKLGPRACTFVLSYSPNSIDVLDVFALLSAVIAKYLPFSSTSGPRLRPNSAGNGFNLPFISFTGFLRVTEKDVSTFRCSLKPHVQHPEQENPFILVALTAPLLPIVLADARCPIKPLGAVNTRNEFVFHDPGFCRDAPAILSSSNNGELTFKVEFGGESRPGIRRKRGMQFSMNIEVRRASQLVLQQELEFLQFLPKSTKPVWEGKEESISHPRPNAGEAGIEKDSRGLKISASKPREWAKSSKDWNPIHVSGLLARCFGFSSAIAHGNHVVALALQEVLDETVAGGSMLDQARGALWGPRREKQIRKMSLSFLKPVLVPAHLGVRWTASGINYDIDIATRKDWDCKGADKVKPRVEVAIEAF